MRTALPLLALALTLPAAALGGEVYSADEITALKGRLNAFADEADSISKAQNGVRGGLASLARSESSNVAEYASGCEGDAGALAGRVGALRDKARSAASCADGSPNEDGTYALDPACIDFNAATEEVAGASGGMQDLKKRLDDGPEGAFADLSRAEDDLRGRLAAAASQFRPPTPRTAQNTESAGGASGSLPPCLPGWDATKWNDPKHTTPKYVIGRIIAKYDHTPAGLRAALPEIQKAIPGTTIKPGKGDVLSIPGVGDVDVIVAAGEGGKAWWWGPIDPNPPADPHATTTTTTTTDPHHPATTTTSDPHHPGTTTQTPAHNYLPTPKETEGGAHGIGSSTSGSTQHASASSSLSWLPSSSVHLDFNGAHAGCSTNSHAVNVTFPSGKTATGCYPQCPSGHATEYALGADGKAHIRCSGS